MKSTFAALVCVLGLAACQDPAQYSEAQVQTENRVDWMLIDHHVMFAPNSAAMSDSEKSRLNAFMARHSVGDTDLVFISVPGSASVDGSRAQAVRHELVDHQRVAVEPGDLPTEAGTALVGDHVTVTVGRYVVTPPDCPNWTKPSGYDHNNTNSSNFGCATEANLGMMVADPRDLLTGQEFGPGDGAANARGVGRYRAGKVRSPLKTKTTTAF